MPEVIETKPICRQPGRYIGWPTVGRTPDGTIHALFSGDRDAHICPGFGKSFIVSSRDGGETWGEPRIINDTPLDDRDTGLCVLADGTMVMSWFTSFSYWQYEVLNAEYRKSGRQVKSWQEWEKKIKAATTRDIECWAPFVRRPPAELSEKWSGAFKEYGCQSAVCYDTRFPVATTRHGFWTRRSTDNGETWDAPTLCPVTAPHGPSILADGRLIFAGNEAWSGNIGFAFSEDKGLTWEMKSRVKNLPERPGTKEGRFPYLCEPHVVATPSGKLVGLARYGGAARHEDCRLWQFDSEDGGLTWSEPRQTGMLGFPPHLLRVSDGRLLASFSLRREPRGHRFCFSPDEGRTWEVDTFLHVSATCDDLGGYPATLELEKGVFLSVYYQDEGRGDKPCLMMTRWKG